MTINLYSALQSNPPKNIPLKPAFTGNKPDISKTNNYKDTVSLSFGSKGRRPSDDESSDNDIDRTEKDKEQGRPENDKPVKSRKPRKGKSKRTGKRKKVKNESEKKKDLPEIVMDIGKGVGNATWRVVETGAAIADGLNGAASSGLIPVKAS